MWRIVVFVCLISWSDAQRGRGPRQSGHNGHGWDIRLAVPGEPGSDYPTLGAIPRTSFSCAGKEPGYYADLETNCQVFRICTTGSTYGFQSFLCPNGTLFNQAVFVCDWWMNVNCQRSQELFNSNNDKFGNLRLGPQLMKDIKKMLTHPMRNPYDKTVMKSNLIVMQDYRPPFGQMFPNGALIAPDRPNSIYVPTKQVQSYNQNVYGNAFAASTPSSQYVPPFNTISTQGDAEVFQRQRQNGQYIQNGRIQSQQSGNLISNGHAGQFTQAQNTVFSNNGNSGAISTQNFNQAQYTQKASYGNTQGFNGQTQRQNAQYTDNRTPQLANGKQSDYGISFSKQQYYNPNQENQAYTNKSPHTHSNQNIGQVNNDAKQNLALVFSILADSLNAAKEYSNIAQQNVIPTRAQQYQNINNEDISQITNKISQLTASQYTANNHNFDHANSAPTAQTITNANQYRAGKYTDNSQNQPQQIRSGQINSVPSANSQGYPARLQNELSSVNANLHSGNQIYSGQLYRLPVPDVTSQFYNAGANIVQTNQHTEAPNISNQSPNNNSGKQSEEVEVVQSRPLPLPAKLQFAPNEESFNSQEHSAQALNFVNNGNGISAQLQDKIVGTIPHPQENKLVTYKKDQSYFVYTNLNNEHRNVQSNSQANLGQQNAKLTQNDLAPNVVSFQFVPSVSYQLEDEKEQQKILNAFQIDEYGNPKKSQNPNGHDISANVNYAIDHPSSDKQVNGQYNDVNTLYTGPSSYSAPQASVGSLETRDGTQNNINARLEQLDENNNGYTKVTPARQFTF